MEKSDIGLIGLAVMGENLALNMESRGFRVSVYNRTTKKTESFISSKGKDRNFFAAENIKKFCESLQTPRKVMLMVKAGGAVDTVIEQLLPFLGKNDIIIDGGNSHYNDTARRTAELAEKGILFVGCGVSGGEEGALHGPSLMPGGNPEAWNEIRKILTEISAKTENGEACCEWMGDMGAGHCVKMVHNGIEYADMQMICEIYDIMRNILKLSCDEISEIFSEWNRTELSSYLIEITSEILIKKDHETGQPLLDMILDVAGQKGTGKWTAATALELGATAPTISEAVFSRYLSSLKEERIEASEKLPSPDAADINDTEEVVSWLKEALLCSKICSYAQGFQILKQAEINFGWTLNYGEIASVWRAGCIIRADFLGRITTAYKNNIKLKNLLLDDYFASLIGKSQDGWRKVVALAAVAGIPLPAISSALSYYDSYRAKNLPANLLQAQRDFFGAHTYERVDKKRGEFYHTDWSA